MWTKEDERRSSEAMLKDLMEAPEEFVKTLGRPRYDRSVAELLGRLANDSSPESQDEAKTPPSWDLIELDFIVSQKTQAAVREWAKDTLEILVKNQTLFSSDQEQTSRIKAELERIVAQRPKEQGT
jgi:hypothetical protein